MKDGWDRYASKIRKSQESYFRKYCDGGSGRKANQASRSDRIFESRKEQEEDLILRDLILSSNSYVDVNYESQFPTEIKIENIRSYDKIAQPIGEENGNRQEEIIKPYQERRQGILEANQGCQRSNQGRCEIEEATTKNREEKMKKISKELKHEKKESVKTEKKEMKKENKKKSK